jgi:hypothetical protein
LRAPIVAQRARHRSWWLLKRQCAFQGSHWLRRFLFGCVIKRLFRSNRVHIPASHSGRTVSFNVMQKPTVTFELLLDPVLSDIYIYFSDKTVIPAQKH